MAKRKWLRDIRKGRWSVACGLTLLIGTGTRVASWAQVYSCPSGTDVNCDGSGSCPGYHTGPSLGDCCTPTGNGCCAYQCYVVSCGSYPPRPPCNQGTGWNSGSFTPNGTCHYVQGQDICGFIS
jgi:hypothetical protein